MKQEGSEMGFCSRRSLRGPGATVILSSKDVRTQAAEAPQGDAHYDRPVSPSSSEHTKLSDFPKMFCHHTWASHRIVKLE